MFNLIILEWKIVLRFLKTFFRLPDKDDAMMLKIAFRFEIVICLEREKLFLKFLT